METLKIIFIVFSLLISSGCQAENKYSLKSSRGNIKAKPKERNIWGEEKLPYPEDVKISREIKSLERITEEFNEVSKKIAYRYCEKANENSLPCCYRLAGLVYASQEAKTPEEFEIKEKIGRLGLDFCQKREMTGGMVYREPVFEKSFEEGKFWTAETWKPFVKQYSDSPYVQLGNIESFSKEPLEIKLRKAKQLQKKHPEYLDIYYFLLDSIRQLMVSNSDSSIKTQKEFEHYKDLYTKEALKQKAWDHLYYLSAYWHPGTKRTDGTTKEEVIDFLKKDLNPESQEFDWENTRD
jgi:hypothetical protein